MYKLRQSKVNPTEEQKAAAAAKIRQLCYEQFPPTVALIRDNPKMQLTLIPISPHPAFVPGLHHIPNSGYLTTLSPSLLLPCGLWHVFAFHKVGARLFPEVFLYPFSKVGLKQMTKKWRNITYCEIRVTSGLVSIAYLHLLPGGVCIHPITLPFPNSPSSSL